MDGRDTRPRCPECGGLAAYSAQYSRCLKGGGCVVLRHGTGGSPQIQSPKYQEEGPRKGASQIALSGLFLRKDSTPRRAAPCLL